MKQRKFLISVVVMALSFVLASVAMAAPDNGENYVFQADDNLARLAEKYYGTSHAYPALIEATNSMAAAQNPAYSAITDPANIWVGQKIFAPDYEQVPQNLLTAVPLADYTGMEMANETAPTAEQLKLLAGLPAKGVPPELNNEVWLNSEPLKLADLHGKVVLIDFWTYG